RRLVGGPGKPLDTPLFRRLQLPEGHLQGRTGSYGSRPISPGSDARRPVFTLRGRARRLREGQEPGPDRASGVLRDGNPIEHSAGPLAHGPRLDAKPLALLRHRDRRLLASVEPGLAGVRLGLRTGGLCAARPANDERLDSILWPSG